MLASFQCMQLLRMYRPSVYLLALLVAASSRPPLDNATAAVFLDPAQLSTTNNTIHLYYLPITWEGNHPEDAYQSLQCDVPCSYAGGLEAEIMLQADAVLFYLPMYSSGPDAITQHMGISRRLYTVAISMEPSGFYPSQFDNVSSFDFEMSFRISSDIPTVYFGFWMDLLAPLSDHPWEHREPAIVFLASHCASNSGREKLVQMLQEHVRVDSLSNCMNNHDWPTGIDRSDKLSLLRGYMVYLAAENNVEPDYVSEKVYDGLIAGAVPIYLGAPNINHFVPKNSVISIPRNFTSADVAQVGEIVQKIFADKREYEKWTSFKQQPYSDDFMRRFNFTHTDPKCRLCRRIFADRYGYEWNKEKQTFGH